MGIAGDQVSSHVASRWVDHLKQNFDGASRPCRHALTGRIDAPKICTRNYECYHCPFDQMLDEMDLVREVDPPAYRLASGYKLADGYYYHMGHSWTRFEHGGRVRIGLDDFAVKVFGLPRALELPSLGEKLKQSQVGWAFARNDHTAAVLAPVSGTVLAINHRAKEHPEIIGADPYDQGWLLIMEPTMPKRNLKGLYYGRESLQWMENEVHRLLGLVGHEYDRLAATGAEPIMDVFGHFPEIGWKRLVENFLRSETV
jgi:glycine cleavage system H lipoate-binding protein